MGRIVGRTPFIVAVVLVASMFTIAATGAAAVAPKVLWTHQLGTAGNDGAAAAAVDRAGDTVIVGSTPGTLPGSLDQNAGDFDGFVAKYDSHGASLWVHQLGSSTFDVLLAVALDSQGAVYVAGESAGTVSGSLDPNAGGSDALLAKYAPDGTLLWVRQLGSPLPDGATGVSVDHNGFVHVVGFANDKLPGAASWGGKSDAFEAEYSTIDGSVQWVKEFGGTKDETPTGVVATRAGASYITGGTFDQIPGAPEAYGGGIDQGDAFIAKLSATGRIVWVHQIGTAVDEIGSAVTLDGAGGAYLIGDASGALPNAPEPYVGEGDAFLARYDTTGSQTWIHELGTTNGAVQAWAVAASATSVDLLGITYGHIAIAPQPAAGGEDGFIARYDSSGTLSAARQFGSSADDYAAGIAFDRRGRLRIAGSTSGTLPGSTESSAGQHDAFVFSLVGF